MPGGMVALIETSSTWPIMLTTIKPETKVTNDSGGIADAAVNATGAPATRAPQEAAAATVEVVSEASLWLLCVVDAVAFL